MGENMTQQHRYTFAQRMGDTLLVIAQRHCEWVGKAHDLEEEVALANIGLDLLGQATAWLELASSLDEQGRSPDDLAYLRNEREYCNYLIAELENGDFAKTILRGYFLSIWLNLLYQGLSASEDEAMRAIAVKADKEVAYHIEHQEMWIERLGHGTEESAQRMQKALAAVWPYTQELFEVDDVERVLTQARIVPDKAAMQQQWQARVTRTLTAAGLQIPEQRYHQRGGLSGRHTETLGYLLAEMQSLKRAFPNVNW